MHKNKFLLALAFFLPTLLLAAGKEVDYDIIERTINFVIFFGLVYYFAADGVRNVFKNRRDEIANALAKIQEKLQDSKNRTIALAFP